MFLTYALTLSWSWADNSGGIYKTRPPSSNGSWRGCLAPWRRTPNALSKLFPEDKFDQKVDKDTCTTTELTSMDFYQRFHPLIYIFCLILILEEPVFHFKCWVPNKGTTGTIFVISLVWRGPWQGIEPWTSRTRSQHSTTRLSRRQWFYYRSEEMLTLKLPIFHSIG